MTDWTQTILWAFAIMLVVFALFFAFADQSDRCGVFGWTSDTCKLKPWMYYVISIVLFIAAVLIGNAKKLTK